MGMSFEEFRASLRLADHRAAMGIQLTDAEAQAVHADTTSAQGWYSYWSSMQPASADPGEYVLPPAPLPAPTLPAPPQQVPAEYVQPATAHATLPLPDYAAYPGATSYPGGAAAYPASGVPSKTRRTALWVILSIVFVLLLAAGGTTAYAFATAKHWTVVDVPEQPETFHSETYETGLYDVTMDEVSPCWVNQDWTDCTNMYVASYNAACTGVSLTPTATTLCTDYAAMIDEMKAQDGDGYYVATLGGNGSLHRSAETATREVSNEDYRPAETHEAVCYLGFIGECE